MKRIFCFYSCPAFLVYLLLILFVACDNSTFINDSREGEKHVPAAALAKAGDADYHYDYFDLSSIGPFTWENPNCHVERFVNRRFGSYFIDDLGQIHLSLRAGSSGNYLVEYGVQINDIWNFEQVITVNWAYSQSLVIDDLGNAHMALINKEPGTDSVIYMERTTQGWVQETIFDSSIDLRDVKILQESNGDIVVLFSVDGVKPNGLGDYRLVQLRKTTQGWVEYTLLDNAYVYDVDKTSNDVYHVVFEDEIRSGPFFNIYYTNSQSWNFEIVYDNMQPEWSKVDIALELDQNDNPIIAMNYNHYDDYDFQDCGIYLSVKTELNWSSWLLHTPQGTYEPYIGLSVDPQNYYVGFIDERKKLIAIARHTYGGQSFFSWEKTRGFALEGFFAEESGAMHFFYSGLYHAVCN